MRRREGHARARGPRLGLAAILALTSTVTAGVAQEPAPILSILERFRGDVRATTTTLAGRFDAFLSDREYEAALNETQLAVKFGVDLGRQGDVTAFIEPRIRLSLPNTERKLFLDIFGTDAARGEDPDAPSGLLPGNVEGGVDAIQLRLGTAFRGVDVAPAVGLRFDEAVPSVYGGVRIGASRQLASGVTLSGSQRFLLDSERWSEAITLLRADWQTDERSLLRAQFLLDWRRDEENLRREPSIIFRRFLDEDTAISLESTLSIETASDRRDQLDTSLRVRRQVGLEGVFAEVRPWLVFEPEASDERTWGLELSLDVSF